MGKGGELPGGTVYFDTSVLVKRYVKETGSENLSNLLTNPRGAVFLISRLVPVEVVSAITMRSRKGDFDSKTASDMIRDMRIDNSSDFQIDEVSQPVLSKAEELILAYALKPADAIHLATALNFSVYISKRITFACADNDLSLAAGKEGLVLWNPMSDTAEQAVGVP